MRSAIRCGGVSEEDAAKEWVHGSSDGTHMYPPSSSQVNLGPKNVVHHIYTYFYTQTFRHIRPVRTPLVLIGLPRECSCAS